ncbi:MAG: DUF1854 domain-containing protein, partial [Thermoguttaceae bacterium]
TIAIAHRLSTLKDADRLIVFDQGRLIEQGTHDELLGQEGLYSTLVSIQGNLRDGRRRVESFLGNQNPSNGKCVAIELGNDGEMLESFAHDDYGSSVRPRLSGNHDKAEEGDLHWLNPTSVVIEGGRHHGGLRVMVDRHSYEDVYAVHAFPASHPRKFISLRRRDSLGHEVEVGMVLSLDQWPRGAQEAMLWSLGRRYLLRQIREIRQIHTSGSSLSLSVVTDSGPSRIHLEKPGEEVQPFGSHGLLLVDAHGCYYVLPDRGALPKRQRRLLTLYFGD